MVDNSENVVRVLFPNKVLHGRVMGGAFALRPHRAEDSVSVFRVSGPTFCNDIKSLDKGRNLECSVMKVAAIRDVRFEHDSNSSRCDVVESADIKLSSHAGIVTYINNQQLIGGCEAAIEIVQGTTLDVIVLAVQHRLALIAQRGLTHVNKLLY